MRLDIPAHQGRGRSVDARHVVAVVRQADLVADPVGREPVRGRLGGQHVGGKRRGRWSGRRSGVAQPGRDGPTGKVSDTGAGPGAGSLISPHPRAETIVTGDDGTFEIKNVPAGKYTVEIWHEKYGSQTKEVTVADGAALDPETDVDRRRLEEAMAVTPCPFTSIDMCAACAADPEGPARRLSGRYAALAASIDAGLALSLRMRADRGVLGGAPAPREGSRL